MLIDRKSRPWILTCLALFAVSAVAYVWYARMPQYRVTGPHGGSWPGLAYGTAGTVMILFAFLLNWRKKVRTLRIGKAYTWTQGHVWFGLLSYPIILFHAAFRWGAGFSVDKPPTLTYVLMWFFTIVIVTGIVGIVLQQYLPTKLLRDVPRETIYEQIKHVLAQLRLEAEELVGAAVERKEQAAFEREVVPAGAGGDVPAMESTEGEQLLQTFYRQEVLPILEDKFASSSLLASEDQATAAFRNVREAVPPPLREVVDDLKSIVDERRQLERQRKLHLALHTWLLIHVPASYVMVVLTIVHVFGALMYTSVGR